MSIATDTDWPPGLLTVFKLCRKMQQPFESRYYGAYNKLLSYCFGPSDDFKFIIAPQSPPSLLSPREAIDFVFYMVVCDSSLRPLLFAEIKDDNWVQRPSTRFKADDQMRERFNEMITDCPLPRLWGLSLIGTSLRVYHCDISGSGVVEPKFRETARSTVLICTITTNTFPNCDDCQLRSNELECAMN
jgi:hypothetical protein